MGDIGIWGYWWGLVNECAVREKKKEKIPIGVESRAEAREAGGRKRGGQSRGAVQGAAVESKTR